MNHRTRQPRHKPTTALDIRSEIIFYRDQLASGCKTKGGIPLFDIIEDLRKDLVKLEPWLAD